MEVAIVPVIVAIGELPSRLRLTMTIIVPRTGLTTVFLTAFLR